MSNKTRFILLAVLGATLITLAFYFALSGKGKKSRNVPEKDINLFVTQDTSAANSGEQVAFKNAYVDSLKSAQENPVAAVAPQSPREVKKEEVRAVKPKPKSFVQKPRATEQAPLEVSPKIEPQKAYDYHDVLRGKIQGKEGVIVVGASRKGEQKQVSDATKQNEYMQVIISNDTKVRQGKKIILKVLKGLTIGGVEIKANSYLYALAEDYGDKYKLVLNQIVTEGGVVNVHLSFYDLQGFEGIRKSDKSKVGGIASDAGASLGTAALSAGGGVVGAVGANVLRSTISGGNTGVASDDTIIPGGLKGYLK